MITFRGFISVAKKYKNYLSVMPKVYKYTLIFDLRPNPLLNKTTVSSCLRIILHLF